MMKTSRLLLGIGVAIAIIFQSCTKNDDSIGTIEIDNSVTNIGGGDSPTPGADRVTVQGDITANRTFDSDTIYELRGGVFVNDGVTLTIEAGTRIEGGNDNGVFAFLATRQGGILDAQGTANSPIVFTSREASPAAGDWGGVLLSGKAPINRGETAVAEVAGLVYGGNETEDNSGTLRYVRIEYSGGKINDESEFNGLSLYGVGSGTTVEFIQIFRGFDDGIEFFGGTVNLKWAIVNGAGDDSFDWTDGWVGNGQFWIAQQFTNRGDKGIEADNLSADTAAEPFSDPTLSNLTLVVVDDGDGENKGIEFRQGTKVTAYNMIVKGLTSKGIEVDDDQTMINLNNGEVEVFFSVIDHPDSFDLDHGGTATVDLNVFNTYWNYTLDGTGTPFNSPGTGIPDSFSLSGFTGTYTYTMAEDGADSFDPATLGSFFTSAAYSGAYRTDDTWLDGWTRQ